MTDQYIDNYIEEFAKLQKIIDYEKNKIEYEKQQNTNLLRSLSNAQTKIIGPNYNKITPNKSDIETYASLFYDILLYLHTDKDPDITKYDRATAKHFETIKTNKKAIKYDDMPKYENINYYTIMQMIKIILIALSSFIFSGEQDLFMTADDPFLEIKRDEKYTNRLLETSNRRLIIYVLLVLANKLNDHDDKNIHRVFIKILKTCLFNKFMKPTAITDDIFPATNLDNSIEYVRTYIHFGNYLGILGVQQIDGINTIFNQYEDWTFMANILNKTPTILHMCILIGFITSTKDIMKDKYNRHYIKLLKFFYDEYKQKCFATIKKKFGDKDYLITNLLNDNYLEKDQISRDLSGIGLNLIKYTDLY